MSNILKEIKESKTTMLVHSIFCEPGESQDIDKVIIRDTDYTERHSEKPVIWIEENMKEPIPTIFMPNDIDDEKVYVALLYILACITSFKNRECDPEYDPFGNRLSAIRMAHFHFGSEAIRSVYEYYGAGCNSNSRFNNDIVGLVDELKRSHAVLSGYNSHAAYRRYNVMTLMCYKENQTLPAFVTNI